MACTPMWGCPVTMGYESHSCRPLGCRSLGRMAKSTVSARPGMWEQPITVAMVSDCQMVYADPFGYYWRSQGMRLPTVRHAMGGQYERSALRSPPSRYLIARSAAERST